MHWSTREEVDRVLYEMLIECGMSKAKAKMIWSAVRLFGRSHWSTPENAPDDAENAGRPEMHREKWRVLESAREHREDEEFFRAPA